MTLSENGMIREESKRVKGRKRWWNTYLYLRVENPWYSKLSIANPLGQFLKVWAMRLSWKNTIRTNTMGGVFSNGVAIIFWGKKICTKEVQTKIKR